MGARVVVIFRSVLNEGAEELHAELMASVGPRADAEAGIVSYSSFSNPAGERVTIVELEDDAALERWATDPVHVAAKARQAEIYERWSIQVAHLDPARDSSSSA